MINVTRPSMPNFDEYCNEIKDLWESAWITNNGIKHKQFQKDLEDYLNISHVTLYTNGHLALENIISAMKLPQGGEVITTPFTFVSTTNAIVRCGLVPVFCDINEQDYTIDVDKIEEVITDKTCAILPVHVYGNICDVDKIKEIADKYKIKVIYDAAHAFGVKYKDKSIVNFGDASMLSFHATKVFNTIEGGAISYNNDEYVHALDCMKNFGLNGEEGIYISGNAKMNEFQAAMGICNLRHIDNEIIKRKKLVEHYRERLKDIKGIKICSEQQNVKSNYAYFPVVFDNYKYARDEILDKLKAEAIIARKYFYPAINDMTCYKEFNNKKTTVAHNIAECVITLPLYADLTIDEIDKICDIILN